jgi:cell surface protein SprA
VLIPAFLAAYSGGSASSQELNAFPQIPLPNWKITYSGLSKIKALKDVFRSVQLTHSYASEYGMGNYMSSLLYDPYYLNLNVPENRIPLPIINPLTNQLSPVLVMDQVSITEAFSPLIGLQLRTKDNFTITLNWNRQRNMALTLSNAQITEMFNNDITADVGWTKAKMKLPFRLPNGQRVLKNDLTFRMAFTLRDTKTTQRKIVDEKQNATVTMGNLNLQIRPTISYVINEKVNMQLYYDYQLNSPRISNSFLRSNTAFGVQVRITL